MSNKIWLSSPHMGGQERDYVQEAFTQNWIAPLGPNVNAFEEELEAFLGDDVKIAALSAGTAAIHLALIQLGVGKDDEVICQSMTFSASANPILYQGATPVFIDSEPDTWNLSPEALDTAIRDRIKRGKKPKAIIAVDLYGMPFKVDDVLEVAHQYDIPVVEDAAEALGSTYKNENCGRFGHFGVLSFNGNKIITTSGGGALVCHNPEDKAESIFLSTQARDPAPHYQHSQIGYNYRLSNVCAGIGRGQMKVLTDRVKQRQAIYHNYVRALSGFPGLEFSKAPSGLISNRWLSTLLIHPDQTHGITREDIRLALQEKNIETRPLWKPMHLQPVFKDYPFYGAEVSANLFKKGLCLPSGSNMSRDDQTRVIEAIKNVLTKKNN